MIPLTTLLRSLGQVGALANARRAVEATARDDWLVGGLVLRLERRAALQHANAAPATAPATATTASAA